MPIVSWECPGCSRTVPLDHFALTTCGIASVHPDFAEAVLRDGDDRYIQDAVTVTNGLGCPRSRAIEKAENVSVNPLGYNALLSGRGWDALMEKHAPAGTAKIVLHGTVDGIELWGEIDRVREVDGVLYIEDHKNGNNFQQKFLKAEGTTKTEHKIQTSLYAELYFQQFRVRPTHGIIWHHFAGAGSSNAPSLMPFSYALLSVEECLSHRPYGGTYTVRELYQQAKAFLDDLTHPFALPLAGETMSFGSKSFCDYCSVRAICMQANKGAPF